MPGSPIYAQVDHIRMTVYYTVPGTTGTMAVTFPHMIMQAGYSPADYTGSYEPVIALRGSYTPTIALKGHYDGS